MHVLHVIDGLGFGGAERMLVDLANEAVARGERVSVCVTRGNTSLAGDLHPSIGRLVLGRTRRLDPLAYVRLLAWLRGRGVDVVHAHMRSSLAFLAPLAASRLLRVPIVLHDHFGTIETDTSVPPWFRVASHLVSNYVGVYDRLGAWARGTGIPADRVDVIANAIDLGRLRAGAADGVRAQLGLPTDRAFGVMVATLRRDKGIEVALAAVAQSKHRGRFVLCIAGADGEPDYVSMVRAKLAELGLEADVRLLGARADVANLLAAADFALLTSHTELGPLVIIEYMAAGLPFVSTLVGDIGRRAHQAGLPGFVAPGDARAVAAALDELLALDPAARRARGLLGTAELGRGWDVSDAWTEWSRVYRKATARRS